MEDINLSGYYESDHEYELMIASHNLAEGAVFYKNVDKPISLRYIIWKLNFIEEKNQMTKREMFGDFRLITNEMDEFNFFLVRLATAIELSLKGIAVYTKLNIFEDGRNELVHYTKIGNAKRSKTYSLSVLINNLDKLFTDKKIRKYKDMFEFFRNMRNEFSHFAKKKQTMNLANIMNNLILANNYFKTVVLPLKDKISRQHIDKESRKLS